METQDLDNLLADYLDGEAPPRRERTRARGGEPAPGPAPVQGASEKPGDLDALLASYLAVERGEQDFSVPRSPEVDDLLRRYVLEEQDVSADLASTLREHVREAREIAEERALAASPARRSSAEWSQTVAARLRETVDIDERVRSYAAAVAQEVERGAAFTDDHESTIKGVPPANAPPIPLGSALARKLKGQQKKR